MDIVKSGPADYMTDTELLNEFGRHSDWVVMLDQTLPVDESSWVVVQNSNNMSRLLIGEPSWRNDTPRDAIRSAINYLSQIGRRPS